MDISRLLIHAQQIKEDKLKERSREMKSSRTSEGNLNYENSYEHGIPRYL